MILSGVVGARIPGVVASRGTIIRGSSGLFHFNFVGVEIRTVISGYCRGAGASVLVDGGEADGKGLRRAVVVVMILFVKFDRAFSVLKKFLEMSDVLHSTFESLDFADFLVFQWRPEGETVSEIPISVVDLLDSLSFSGISSIYLIWGFSRNPFQSCRTEVA